MGAAQLALPLAFAPEPVRTHGLRAAHPRPLVSLGKRLGRPFASFRTTPAKAWRYPELEYGNAGSSIAALVLDCDRPKAWRMGVGDLPPYSWLVRRSANDHAHIAWCLDQPVHKYPAARVEPLRYFAGIAEYYAHAVGADPGYAGLLAHNPACRFKTPYKTIWGREEPYTLDQLANVIPFNWEPPNVRQTGVGRNVDLFEAGMRWAGKRANADLPVLPALLTVNQEFEHPLPMSEVQATARSRRKVPRTLESSGLALPAMAGSASGAVGKADRKARKASASHEGSNEALRPWEADRVSRRTWYRRRRAAREGGTVPNTGKPPLACL